MTEVKKTAANFMYEGARTFNLDNRTVNRMKRDGFKDFSVLEMLIYEVKGADFLTKVYETPFEFACVMADYQGIEKNSSHFNSICDGFRDSWIYTIATEIVDRLNEGHSPKSIVYCPPSEDKILEQIKLRCGKKKK